MTFSYSACGITFDSEATLRSHRNCYCQIPRWLEKKDLEAIYKKVGKKVGQSSKTLKQRKKHDSSDGSAAGKKDDEDKKEETKKNV